MLKPAGKPSVRIKFIAACLILTMVSWVESLALPLAPEHAMHTQMLAGHSHMPGMSHPCCPRPAALSTPLPPQPSRSGEEHRCCFLRAPQAPPAGSKFEIRSTPHTIAHSVVGVAQTRTSHLEPRTTSSDRLLELRSLRSVVLRS